MTFRKCATWIIAFGLTLTALTTVAATPARAGVCDGLPPECEQVKQEIMTQVRYWQVVCERIPQAYGPNGNGSGAAFCDDPEVWASDYVAAYCEVYCSPEAVIELVRRIYQENFCPDGRCDAMELARGVDSWICSRVGDECLEPARTETKTPG